MSQNLRDLAITRYRALFEKAYQSGSKLRSRVLVFPGIER